jgi:hypothetical protein
MRETGKVHNWLPFHSEAEARHALLTYAIHANLPDAALIWTDATGAKLLQQGTADKDGDVKVLIAHAHGPIPPPVVPPPPPSMLDSFENTVAKLLEGAAADAKAAGSAIAGAAKTAGQDIAGGWQTANKFVGDHPLAFDGATVAFDAVAVIGGGFAIATLGVAGVGVLGMVATGAAFTLLIADGTHYAFEVADKGFHAKGAEQGTKWVEENDAYKTIEWISPLLCLPDLVVNMPKAFTEAKTLAREAKDAQAAVQEGTEAVTKAENRLTNYIEKRSNDPQKPPLVSTQQRYARQINAAQRAQKALADKFTEKVKDSRNSNIRAAFAGVGVPGTAFGLGVIAVHPPDAASWMSSAGNAIAGGWHDIGSWFTPKPSDYPVMPDADNRIYRGGFHGGYSVRRGDDPWADMQSYLSIHLAMTRIRPR